MHLARAKIPLRWHAAFTALTLATAVCGNASVDFRLPFPIYLIIKSSNLIANLLLGGPAARPEPRLRCSHSRDAESHS